MQPEAKQEEKKVDSEVESDEDDVKKAEVQAEHDVESDHTPSDDHVSIPVQTEDDVTATKQS